MSGSIDFSCRSRRSDCRTSRASIPIGENTRKGLLNPTLNTKNKGSLFSPPRKVRNFFLSTRSKQGRCTGNKYCHMGINYCLQLSLKYSDNAPLLRDVTSCMEEGREFFLEDFPAHGSCVVECNTKLTLYGAN